MWTSSIFRLDLSSLGGHNFLQRHFLLMPSTNKMFLVSRRIFLSTGRVNSAMREKRYGGERRHGTLNVPGGGRNAHFWTSRMRVTLARKNFRSIGPTVKKLRVRRGLTDSPVSAVYGGMRTKTEGGRQTAFKLTGSFNDR
jgi:hypothetical protein